MNRPNRAFAALSLLAFLPGFAAAETLYRCDLQFYPAQIGEDAESSLTVLATGSVITAGVGSTYSGVSAFNCEYLGDGALECYGFFDGDRGTARQLNIQKGAPAIGTPIIISAITLGFLEENYTADGFIKTDRTNRRIAQSLMEITSCDEPAS